MTEATGRRGPHGWRIPTQEGIGFKFKFDAGWNRRAVRGAIPGDVFAAPLHGDAARFDRLGEAQVALGVFMGAIDQSRRRQYGELGQRFLHLRRRAFEQAPATCAEQRVTAEYGAVVAKTWAIIGDVAAGMSGHGDDVEFDADFGQFDVFAAGQRMRNAGDILLCRTIQGDGIAGQQFRHAADVVAVVVGYKYGAEAVTGVCKMPEHRNCVAGVDHDDATAGAQQPDVVVVESGQGQYFSHSGIFSKRGAMSIQGFEDWLNTPSGQYVLNWEQQKHDLLVADIFGFNAVQLSLPNHDFLGANRMPLRFRCDDGRYDGMSEVRSDLHYLPFAGNSIDLVVMPHTLEFDANPHQVLREVERVLVPEGHVIVTGFNPFSLWGAKRKLSRQEALPPWRGAYLSVPRLKDWFSLLGLEMQAGAFGCYAPAVTQEKWLRRFQFMDAAGDRWWPIAGAVYIVQAVKRQQGMRLITPAWQDRKLRAKALVSIAQKTVSDQTKLGSSLSEATEVKVDQ